MEVGARSGRHLLITAALALLMLGLGLSFLTWQNVRQQRINVLRHLAVSSRIILGGVEASMVREIRFSHHGRMRGQGRGPMPDHMTQDGPPGTFGGGRGRGFAPSTPLAPAGPALKELFKDMAAGSDIAFLALYAPDGTVMVASHEPGDDHYPSLSPEAIEAMRTQGIWHGLARATWGEAFVAGSRVRPGLGRLCQSDSSLNCGSPGQGVPFLVAALDATPHLSQYRSYRRAAMLQTGYVLMATLLLYALGLAVVRRTGQGRALMRLERFHSKLLDTMPDGLLTVDGQGRIVAANPAARNILSPSGRDDSESPGLVGRAWDDLPLSRVSGGEETRQGRAWDQYDLAGRSLEVLSLPIPPDPSSGGPDSPENSGQRLVLVRDRTVIKALERDLAEAERLAAIGRLAAALAHEIRNPLSSLRGFAQYFQGRLKGQSPEEDYARTMVSEADRVNKVVTDLLFLARPRTPECEPVDLAALARDMKDLLRLDLERQGAILDFDIKAPEAMADPDMLKQAVLNLLVNALAAAGENTGRIVLASRAVDDKVEIVVADNGPGLEPEAAKRALEPFFTTRKEGTGLGLAIVDKIMRAHGGAVTLKAKDGQAGAEAVLAFPRPGGER